MSGPSVNELRQAIADALLILRQGQRPNGQFIGLASPYPDDFTSANYHQTTFFTSLIVACLDTVSTVTDIKLKAANFILSERSAQWSWNYWLRDSDDFRLRPYPDDLDDTACALAALALSEEKLLTQEGLAGFAKLLISQEVKPGGPYTTWLVSSTAQAIWKDIDIAVNANIGYFLKTQSIKLNSLEDYITKQITTDALKSPYYLGKIPVIYFIARWYDGPAKHQLLLKIKEMLAQPQKLSDLELSMLLTAELNLNSETVIGPQIKNLLKRQTKMGWSAAALYYEPDVDGIKYYAGSSELTTAMAIEALQKYLSLIPRKIGSTSSGVNYQPDKPVNSDSKNLELMSQTYLEKLSSNDINGQITRIASMTDSSLSTNIAREPLRYLNLASLNGWASYTLFDDFFDGDGQADKLPLGMLTLRRAVSYFHKALPGNQAFADYVEAALDTVDKANDWELKNCRLPLQLMEITLPDLPKFKDLSQLANKSWGHSLASTGVLLAAGFPLDETEQSELRKFYHHYLIARQLNDDAHDWSEDLLNGQLSYVVTDLLTSYLKSHHINSVCPAKELSSLRTHFWSYTISDIIMLINENLSLARHALGRCHAISDPSVFMAWIGEIQAATDKATRSKIDAEAFINSFTAK